MYLLLARRRRRERGARLDAGAGRICRDFEPWRTLPQQKGQDHAGFVCRVCVVDAHDRLCGRRLGAGRSLQDQVAALRDRSARETRKGFRCAAARPGWFGPTRSATLFAIRSLTQLQQCNSKVFVETAGYAGAAGCFHYISGV